MQTARRSCRSGVSRINRIECLAIRSRRGVSRSTDKMGTSGPYRRIDPLIRRMSNTGHRRGERLEVSLPRSPTLTFDSDTAQNLNDTVDTLLDKLHHPRRSVRRMKSKPRAKATLRSPTTKEAEAILDATDRISKRRKRVQASIESYDAGECRIASKHSDGQGWSAQLTDAFGTTSEDFANVTLTQTMNALPLSEIRYPE